MEKRLKILVVEDDKMLSFTFEMFIEQFEYEFIGAFASGKEAINKCNEEKPDVVIMDIHISGEMNGIETAKVIEQEFDVPIIYLSSDIEHETFLQTIQKNTYGFLVKPITKKASLRTTIEFAYYKHRYDRNLSLTNQS